MTWKRIEASRETRLWLTQVILPIVTVVALVPEARDTVVKTSEKVKTSIKSKFKK